MAKSTEVKPDAKAGKLTEEKPGKSETTSVEKVKPAKAEKPPKGAINERVSGTHRVKFMPNGNNPKLGEKMLRPSADVAQSFVDKGWGSVIAK